MKILGRFLFAFKHKTLKRISCDKDSSAPLSVYHKGKEVKVRRRCSHQGGPLEKGYIQGDFLVCPWHGCHFSLANPSSLKPFSPALGTQNEPLPDKPLEIISQP